MDRRSDFLLMGVSAWFVEFQKKKKKSPGKSPGATDMGLLYCLGPLLFWLVLD